MTKVEMIHSIASLAEIEGYEAEAKQRGLTVEEITALYERRKQLTPKRRRT